MDKSEILVTLKKNRAKLKRFGVTRLLLVGSYANDSQTKGSDVDFIVEFRKGRGLFRDYSGVCNLLEDSLHRKVDLMKETLLKEEIRQSMMGGKVYEAEV